MEMNIVDVRENLAEVINRVAYAGERIIFDGEQERAAVVSMEDLQLLQALEDQADVKAAIKARKEKGRCPWRRSRKG